MNSVSRNGRMAGLLPTIMMLVSSAMYGQSELDEYSDGIRYTKKDESCIPYDNYIIKT
jgi:hypothetical protein